MDTHTFYPTPIVDVAIVDVAVRDLVVAVRDLVVAVVDRKTLL